MKTSQLGKRVKAMKRLQSFRDVIQQGNVSVFIPLILLVVFGWVVVDQAQAKVSQARTQSKSCAAAGCHVLVDGGAVTVGWENITTPNAPALYGASIDVNANEFFEIDWRWLGLTTKSAGANIEVPAGWTVQNPGSTNTAVPGWHVSWDTIPLDNIGTPYTPANAGYDAYNINYGGTAYDSGAPDTATNDGSEPDGQANDMGASVRVRAGSAGSYTVYVYAVGHTTAKAHRVVPLTINVSAVGNQNPNVPTNLQQFQSDGLTPIASNGYATATTVAIEADISDNDAGDQIKLQVDIDGNGTSDCESALGVNPRTNVQVNCAVVNGNSYDWQVRTVDNAGTPANSAWQPFAGTPDFTVDTTAPSVSPPTTPSNGATGITLNSQVTINFDENVDCTNVTTGTVTSDNPTWTLNNCSGSTAIFDTGGQANDTVYAVTVTTGVTDFAGNALRSSYPFSYRTALLVNNPPSNPSGLVQYQSNGSTSITKSTYTKETTLVMGATVTDGDSPTIQLDVEIQPIASSFTNNPNCTSDPGVATTNEAKSNCTGLGDGRYKWQARARDDAGATSGWVQY
jgi:hypothetical protein